MADITDGLLARIAEKERAEREAEIAKQKANGRVALVPMPKVPMQPFRSELTVERHEQGYSLAEWQGDHYGLVISSAYELVKTICGSDAARHYKRVRTLLQDLHSIPIVIENGYTWQGIRDRDEFTLLSIIDWKERRVSKSPTPKGKSEVRVMLSRLVTEGFLRKNVKQLLLKPYVKLGAGGRGPQAGLARLLYPRLDGELANKDEYNVRLEELAKRLGVAPQRYRSKRRERFLEAVRLLNGQLIQGERYRLRVDLRDTDDKRDYVLVASREANQLSLFDRR